MNWLSTGAIDILSLFMPRLNIMQYAIFHCLSFFVQPLGRAAGTAVNAGCAGHRMEINGQNQ
ncbi:hypothetical protein NKI19_24075 [Mesorhizobium sp. M0751]|uniref:hypothetical protein n=1 Tax=unclassified Mesorhizobium TaxID=325217 RepID=UPI00333781A1